jgi:peptidoglycan/LPS O-acetylase OafA/YrhL
LIEICRYLLAALVAQTHLWPVGGVLWTGNIAVFAFYTLSGYLMTRVLNTRYGFTWRGTGAFALNRILRLWPAYLAILLAVVLADQVLPLSKFLAIIRTPSNPEEIVTNIIVIGQVTFDYVQWFPMAKPLVTSWSLSIEVCCYLLLALFFARSSARLWIFMLCGVLGVTASTAYCALSTDAAAYGPYCFQNRYGVIQAGFVPFAAGGLYYFHEKWLTNFIRKRFVVVLAALASAVAAMFGGAWLSATIGPYLGIPLTFILLAAAQDYRPTRTQDFVGRASYHLFIAHLPIAAILVTGFHARPYKLLTYLSVLVGALLVSAALVPLEWRINKLRFRISSSLPKG